MKNSKMLFLLLGIFILNSLSFGQIFTEDWETGIDPAIWKSFGSPEPVSYPGEGRNNTVGFDCNGDGSYDSGACSWQNFNLTERPVLEFWCKGHNSNLTYQNLSVSWSETDASGYVGTGAQPQPIINFEMAPETQYNHIRFMVLSEQYYEDWNLQDQWIHCKIVINEDGTVSFYRSEPPGTALILHYTSTTSLELSNYSEQALALAGRSYDSHQIIDDVIVWAENSPDFNVELTYLSGSPVPAEGGNINYDLLINYNSSDPIDFDAWLATEYEGGAPTTLVMRAFFDYQPGWTINRPGMYYPIPASWAAGNYDFFCRVGSEPDVVWAEDSFPFEKLGASDGIAFVPFAVDGAPNPFDDIIASGGIVSQPESHALFAAYPNPFNPTTNLSYNLDAAGQVKLSIYDIQGRLLTTLVDGFRDAGIHEVTFGAEGLSSGIYFARIEAGNRSVMQKLMLVK